MYTLSKFIQYRHLFFFQVFIFALKTSRIDFCLGHWPFILKANVTRFLCHWSLNWVTVTIRSDHLFLTTLMRKLFFLANLFYKNWLFTFDVFLFIAVYTNIMCYTSFLLTLGLDHTIGVLHRNICVFEVFFGFSIQLHFISIDNPRLVGDDSRTKCTSTVTEQDIYYIEITFTYSVYLSIFH